MPPEKEKPKVEFHFTIPGQPMAKIRKTRFQAWRPEVKRYASYKDKVRHAFIEYMGNKSAPYVKTWIADGKPLHVPLTSKIWMEVEIVFNNEIHGDPEGIFGAIADSLFGNDKHCAGSFDFSHDRQATPKVDVSIYIYPECT